MTEQFEREVKCALELFRATIARATERAAIEAIRIAFAQVSIHAGVVEANSRGDTPGSAEPATVMAERRTPRQTRGTSATVVPARLIACIREHPGSGLSQLGRLLGARPDTLRRHLQKLVADGSVRVEETALGWFGGHRRRTYFMADHADGSRVEPAAGAAAATA